MKAIRIIPVILLFANLCFSQTGWYQVNSGIGRNLRNVFFLNNNTGFTVGEKGTVLKSTNEGLQWASVQLADTLMDMRNVYFKNQLTGYILGNFFPLGLFPPTDSFFTRVYKTTNSGVSWFADGPDLENIFMKNIEFINENVGFMTGGLYAHGGPNRILKTTNGGLNWTDLPCTENQALLSHKFLDENTGFISTLNKIYKTTNGGVNWTAVFTQPGEFNAVHTIKFLNSNTGYACGGMSTFTEAKSRFIIKTTNAGATWSYLLNDTLGMLINNLIILNENYLYACGSVAFDGSVANTGKILKTVNGGSTWTEEQTPTLNPLSGIFNNNSKGFAVGSYGTIYKNDNIVSVTQISTVVPSSMNLDQNYPNPFNPTTTINFDIPKQSFVSLNVYDMTGKEVRNLFQGIKAPGSYQVKFDGLNLNSGVYFYKLMTDGTSITKSMVLVK